MDINTSIKREAGVCPLNYNGEALRPGEVLVRSPYEARLDRDSVTNRASLVTVSLAGRRVPAVLRAVPAEFAPVARAQFNSWQRDFLPKQEKLSLDHVLEAHGLDLTDAPAADDGSEEACALTEARQRLRETAAALLERSPRHCLALLLMGLGYKGAAFAGRMRLKHDAASRVRRQILALAPDRISSLAELDLEGLHVNRTGDTDYYRAEAEKALEELLRLYY